MKWFVALAWVVGSAMALSAEPGTIRELIHDNRFQHGFGLWETKPGRHIRYGVLNGPSSNAEPAWGLSQWSSQFPLDPARSIRTPGMLVCSNAAKGITLSESDGFTLAVNSAVEYGAKARVAKDPWVHLLVEQEFTEPARLSELTGAILHVEARLLHSRNLHQGDYSPDVHAAQFQIFFTVQNRNRDSKAFGDLLWFGIPLYDNRHRFPPEFKAQDFGGTSKFIFTPGGKTFSKQSAHDGQWIIVDKDLLPLMREALETAWSRGFLQGSKTMADYSIGGMNMGWELPGTFDVAMQVRGLSLKINSRPK